MHTQTRDSSKPQQWSFKREDLKYSPFHMTIFIIHNRGRVQLITSFCSAFFFFAWKNDLILSRLVMCIYLIVFDEEEIDF